MSLRRASRAGALALAAVAVGGFGEAASATGGSRSTRRYPAPLPSRGGALQACPSPAGLEAFDAPARRQARRETLAYSRAPLASALANSDRAWQPRVTALWRSGAARREAQVVRAVAAAGRSPYRVIVSYSCGRRLIRRSLVVALAPVQPAGEPHCEACVESFFLVDRRGRALIYFVY
jgi:hypothetical protein